MLVHLNIPIFLCAWGKGRFYLSVNKLHYSLSDYGACYPEHYVYVCVFVFCSDERDLDGFSVSKRDAVCFCLSHSKSQRALSLTTEGSLYVYMASSTNWMHAEHVRANTHMQMLMHCMCALLHSNPHTHTHS